MIKKYFELNKLNIDKFKYYLFYGENEGLKQEIIERKFKNNFKNDIFHYDESEILKNEKNFINEISSKSFFENKKLFIISRSTDKILSICDDILNSGDEEITIIFISDKLEKRSKLRSLFEKDNKLICIPFYSDNYQTLSYIIKDFFKKIKIPISQEILNTMINRSNGDRKNLNNELIKIQSYSKNKKTITHEEILKLTNLSENYDYSELVDFCLAKNQRKTVDIINDNYFSNDDTLKIIRIFLFKVKRLLVLKKETLKNKSIENVILSHRPPIFWKDKDFIKKQLNILTQKNLENLVKNINETELLMKKNYENSINILLDFIFRNSKSINNYS